MGVSVHFITQKIFVRSLKIKENVLKQSVEIDTNKPVGNGKEADATEVKAVNSEGF